MREGIRRLAPARWKVFQCLVLEGENAGEGALRVRLHTPPLSACASDPPALPACDGRMGCNKST